MLIFNMFIMEVFKDIVGYEGLYQVSNLGNIKSLEKIINRKIGPYVSKEKILKPLLDKNNYCLVGLFKNKKGKTFKIHRLVAESFISDFKDVLQVNHKDFNRQNNRLENIEMCSSFNNNVHKNINKKFTSKYLFICFSSIEKKWKVTFNKKHLGTFKTEEEAKNSLLLYLKSIDFNININRL